MMIYKLVFKNDEIGENELILCEINKDDLDNPPTGIMIQQNNDYNKGFSFKYGSVLDNLINVNNNLNSVYYVNFDNKNLLPPKLIDIITKQNRLNKLNELNENL